MGERPMHIQEGHAGPWCRWFAWYPVEMGCGCTTWLRWIERRWFYAAPWFCIWRWREYRQPEPGGERP